MRILRINAGSNKQNLLFIEDHFIEINKMILLSVIIKEDIL